jgi:3-oxoacyl-[acyl-carrier protein] reductase
MKHEGKVAVVTGAGQGMGQAIVECLVAEGAQVAALDVNSETVEQTASRLGEKVIGLACDVSDSAAVKKAFETAASKFGRLDIVVNSAGTGSVDTFLDTPDEHWDRVIGVNLTGTFYCCREGARLMKQSGNGGVIINISSSAFCSGEGPSHYVASKAGVVGLTRSITGELAGYGIRVNTLVPGATDTPMMAGIPDEWRDQMIQGIPLGRMGEAVEVARVASFLASDDASFMTGQNVGVNGGMVYI